jgi:hypothetical protein
MAGFSSDYGSSRDYDFSSSSRVTGKSAKDYAKQDKREYSAPTVGLPSPVGVNLSTTSPLSVLLLLDQTGSMGESPKYIINKMPTMYAESNAAVQGKKLEELAKGEKLEDILEVGVIAIGDERNHEQYPLQAVDYAKGGTLVKNVLRVFPEHNGGGNARESYDLGMYFALKHVQTPQIQGIKPIMIIVGDEGFYEDIRASEVKKHTGDVLHRDLKTREVIKDLTNKFDVYMLRPEMSYDSTTYANVHKQWQDVLGTERVLKVEGDYQRIVDCFIGICGFAADNFSEAEAMLKRRQTPSQVSEVLATLHPLLSSKESSSGSSKRTGK